MVCAILGTTYTGQYEDVKTIDKLLGEKNKKEGLNVFIHVDAASGGFVAPCESNISLRCASCMLDDLTVANPDLVWDFQLVSLASPKNYFSLIQTLP